MSEPDDQIRDVTDALGAAGPSGIESYRPESDDEVATMNLTRPEGTPIRLPIFCSSLAARPPR